QTEFRDQQPELRGVDRWYHQEHQWTADQENDPPRSPHIPRPMDEVAGQSAAHEVPEIRAYERNPETDERFLQFESAAHQKEREPSGDEKPVGVENRFCQYDAPRLPVLQKVSDRDTRCRRRFARAGTCFENHVALGITDKRVLLWPVIRRHPYQEP